MRHHPAATLAALTLAAATAAPAADWRLELERWRADYEAGLREANGWLSVVGLHWLDEGETVFGSGPGAGLELRPPVPPVAGRLLVRDGQVRVRLEPGVDAALGETDEDGWRTLRPNVREASERVDFGSLRFFILQRGERFAVRLIDEEAPNRQAFEGVRWYPPAEKWRLRARFVTPDEPTTVRIADVTGRIVEYESPGYAVFEVDGHEQELHAIPSGSPDELLYVFRDATAGRGSYGAGRFLYSPQPEEGFVELDFNRAESPPCAYTAFATCPLPPRVNWLDVAVEAGEKDPELIH